MDQPVDLTYRCRVSPSSPSSDAIFRRPGANFIILFSIIYIFCYKLKQGAFGPVWAEFKTIRLF
jgi:hypothetical protein